MFIVDWNKCEGDIWCDLNRLDLEHHYIVGFKGIYVIWCGSLNDRTVITVGYGRIDTELKEKRADLAVQAFSAHGIKVSWADIPAGKKKSILTFLNRDLKPKIPLKPAPKAKPLEINYPWDKIEE